MTDHLFSAVLTFSLLAAGTVAMGSEVLASRHATASPKATAVATLPTVTVTGKRIAAAAPAARPEVVTLPTVVVTGRRQGATRIAAGDSSGDRRVQ